jgi:2-dehydropantoate 2-reductase
VPYLPDFHEVVFQGLASYGTHFPSTKMDFDAGAALEIDSLNGYVLNPKPYTLNL